MLWYCGQCTTAYAVGLPRCPHCGRPADDLVTAPREIEQPQVRPQPKRRGKPEEDTDGDG